MSTDCVFCRIAAGQIPAEIVWQDDRALAFSDINPQAPTHVLVIPRKHVIDVVEAANDADAGADLLHGLAATVSALNLPEFRTVLNTGAGAGQSVFHVHAHVLAGQRLEWPAG